MEKYRNLTDDEISLLEKNNCWAEDWNRVLVKEKFTPYGFHRVVFYGDIRLGVFDGTCEIAEGFFKHCGISDATLRNVSVDDNCLIEKIGNFINNYTIGKRCYISNVSTLQTTSGANFGEGRLISVLNEMGEGNLVLSCALTSQIAAMMVKYRADEKFFKALSSMLYNHIGNSRPRCSVIGDNVRIVNTREVTDTVIGDNCEVSGASLLKNCSLLSEKGEGVYVGTGVICENSIVGSGSLVSNSVKMQNCFVGETCEITNGFTAEASVFFANCFLANGEACAAFCGPFTTSHHKSSLMIGGMFSFYNAGSSTNFSNHAYKMGPLHYGTFERGCKTASGAYVLMPATIGAFSVCFGKLMHHPSTQSLPFSYLISYNDNMYLVPGRNITTVGLYRDIKKWPKRDKRKPSQRKSIINFDWLSPFTVGEIIRGKKILEALQKASGSNASTYNYHEYIINASSLRKGIKYYDIALRIYMGAVLKRAIKEGFLNRPFDNVGLGEWTDLSGLLLPVSEEERLCKDIKEGVLSTIEEVIARLDDIHARYRSYQWVWTHDLICRYYNLDSLTPQNCEAIHADYVKARRAWIAEIRKDAEKEFAMGDVEPATLQNFIDQLDRETEYEY